MPAIYPIVTTRVSDSLIQARLLSQLEFDDLELARIQDQVSTGYRISTPSQDSPAAIRAVALQRWLEQKHQAKINLATTNSFVSATDTALTGATDLLNHAKSVALSAIDSTNSSERRAVLRTQVEEAIQQFLDIGNRQFRGRYLFAGSKATTQPFTFDEQYVSYQGNDTKLRNYADVDFLATTNVTGADAFGAVSAEVRGSRDLNPVLTLDTKLSDLRGGNGISQGSIVISDGTNSRTVDLASAATVRDVVDLIEANPPTGRDINVFLSNYGLVIDLDDAGGGSLTINEITGGTTAAELGILAVSGVGTAPLNGNDLNPQLTLATRLQDLLGTRSKTRLLSADLNNDIAIESAQNGAIYNGVTVQFVHLVASGDQAFATYDSVGNTLTIDISSGVTRASTVVAAINSTGTFTAQLDSHDDRNNDGTGLVDISATAVTSGGSGENLDTNSGLQVVNDGSTHVLDLSSAETIQDLLNLLNGSDAGLTAGLNASASGIDIRSRISGADFMIGENGGQTATQLGVRSLTGQTYLADLNYFQGINPYNGIDFTIQRRDGVNLAIDVSSAQSLQDVIDLINNHPANVGNVATARLAQVGNGIELVDANAAGTSALTVFRTNGFAAWQLGLIPTNQDQSVAAAPAPGQPQILTGRDVNPLETSGVFNSLLRLSAAIEAGDIPQIQRAAALLDSNFLDITFVRADLGGKASSLDTLNQRIEREDIEMQTALSNEIDADLVKATSDLAARQTNLEASLRLAAQIFRLSILDFL